MSEPAGDQVVRIERPATGGAVAHLDDGRVVFVRHALPGELVRISLSEATTRYARADAVEVLEASPERVDAPCPYAHPGGCGGCDLQHASGDAQRTWKGALVQEHLRRLAGVSCEVEVRAAPGPVRGSRTRLRCAVDGDGALALRAVRSHDLVRLDACWIADERLAPAFATSWAGVDEVELRALGEGDPFAVVRRGVGRDARVEARTLAGAAHGASFESRVTVEGHTFVISPRSFWQSHRAAPETLLSTVRSFAGVSAGDHVVDLFSGVGLFAVPLAREVGPRGRVTAVEASPHATRDARRNGEGLSHLRVREWSVTPRAVNDAVAAGDVVVLDPPRTGLARGVAAALVRRAPRRIVYVSCDAATFSRDLAALLAGGYRLADLAVFDLFPMTEHVELVALLDMAP